MREFSDFVHNKLRSLALATERKEEIVEEIAAHMQAAYEEALERGATEDEAAAFAESSFTPWEDLQGSIEQAERIRAAEPSTSERGEQENRERSVRGIGTMLAGSNIWAARLAPAGPMVKWSPIGSAAILGANNSAISFISLKTSVSPAW